MASFEFIPWVLAQCATLDEVRELIADLNIVDTPFSENLPSGMLHWIISDKRGSITVESMKDGLHIHENPVVVLTNNPPFEQQMFMLNNYMGLSPKQPENHFTDKLDVKILQISAPVWERNLYMIHDRQAFMPPAVRNFCEFVLKKCGIL